MTTEDSGLDQRLDLTGLVDRYGFTRSWWRKAVYGGLPHVKHGNRSRAKTWVQVRDAEAYLESHTATEAAPQPPELRSGTR